MTSMHPDSPASGAVKAHSLRHDLLTPMNHVLGFSEMLLEDASGASVASLEEIHWNGKQLVTLITGLFDASGAMIGTVADGRKIHALVERVESQVQALLASLSSVEHQAMAPDLGNVAKAIGTLRGSINAVSALSETSDAAAAAVQQPAMHAAALSQQEKPRAHASTAATGARKQAPAEHRYGPLLVVDDNENNRDMLSRRLIRLGYTVHTAEDGTAALEMMERAKYDLVLLDVMMPGLDGYDVLQRMKSDERLQDIPVIMISALQEIDSIVRCITLGAEDYLPKPFDPVLLKARVGACLEKKRLHDQTVIHLRQIEKYNTHLEEMVREQVRDISKAQLGAIFALSKLAESRDEDTGSHLERVREYCKILGEELRKREKYAQRIDQNYIDTLCAASPLHDIGKVGIPDHILLKNGKLTAEEFEIMKTHATIGAATLRAADREHPGNNFLQVGVEIAEGHHEKWDGSGYPHGLAGEAIPLTARIVALADVYDALRTRRCYKDAFSHQKSCGIIADSRGKHFDPDVVDCFFGREQDFQAVWARLSEES
ncbi:response regulator [Herbaspirillum sp. HC18]|nr:response regulator [Herbaspirillum sp. HC18]